MASTVKESGTFTVGLAHCKRSFKMNRTEPGLWNLCVARRKFHTKNPEPTLWDWPAAGAIFKMSLAEPGLWNFCVARRKFQTMGHC